MGKFENEVNVQRCALNIPAAAVAGTAPPFSGGRFSNGMAAEAKRRRLSERSRRRMLQDEVTRTLAMTKRRPKGELCRGQLRFIALAGPIPSREFDGSLGVRQSVQRCGESWEAERDFGEHAHMKRVSSQLAAA